MLMRVMSGADFCIEPQSSGSCCAFDTINFQASRPQCSCTWHMCTPILQVH